jgi:hypothetical protein
LPGFSHVFRRRWEKNVTDVPARSSDPMIWHFVLAHVFVALQLQADDNLEGDVTLRLQ